MDFQLVVIKGRAATTALKLQDGVTTAGRQDDCHLRIRSSQVSRKHCELFEKHGLLLVKDLGSSNGTFVNGKKIDGQRVMEPGDELAIGPITFRVEKIGQPAPPRPVAAPAAAKSPATPTSRAIGVAEAAAVAADDDFEIEFDETPSASAATTSASRSSSTTAVTAPAAAEPEPKPRQGRRQGQGARAPARGAGRRRRRRDRRLPLGHQARPDSTYSAVRMCSSRSWRASTVAGAPGHQVGAPGGLGEGDAVADVGQAGVEHHQPVEPERDAAVGRCAVAEGAEQEAELLLGLLGGQAEQREDLRLDLRVVAADRAAAALLAVDDQVVRLGPDLGRVGVEQGRSSARGIVNGWCSAA